MDQKALVTSDGQTAPKAWGSLYISREIPNENNKVKAFLLLEMESCLKIT